MIQSFILFFYGCAGCAECLWPGGFQGLLEFLECRGLGVHHLCHGGSFCGSDFWLCSTESLRCLCCHRNLCAFDHGDGGDHRYNVFLHCSGQRTLMQTIDGRERFQLLKRPNFKPFGMGILIIINWVLFFPSISSPGMPSC